MHISTVNISNTVTCRASITSNMMSHDGLRLVYLVLILAYCNGQLPLCNAVQNNILPPCFWFDVIAVDKHLLFFSSKLTAAERTATGGSCGCGSCLCCCRNYRTSPSPPAAAAEPGVTWDGDRLAVQTAWCLQVTRHDYHVLRRRDSHDSVVIYWNIARI